MKTTNYLKNVVGLFCLISIVLMLSYCHGGSMRDNTQSKRLYAPVTEEADDGFMVTDTELAPKDFKKEDFNTESYDKIVENAFVGTISNPLSTFSVDVDRD